MENGIDEKISRIPCRQICAYNKCHYAAKGRGKKAMHKALNMMKWLAEVKENEKDISKELPNKKVSDLPS